MRNFGPGDRVRHAHYGEGTVLTRRLGSHAKVRFDATTHLPRTIARRDLRLLTPPKDESSSNGAGADLANESDSSGPARGDDSKAVATPDPDPRPEGLDPVQRADLRQTMEALRLGVVPSRFVREYTVARRAELARVEELLEARRGYRVIWGDYGAGKTHMLDVIEQLAQEQGFVTARIVVDPLEVPPTHPKRLYRAVVSALTCPQEGGRGLDTLLQRMVESRDHREPKGECVSRFFSPYLHSLRDGDEETRAWLQDYVQGYNIDATEVNRRLGRIGWRGERVLALSDYRTYGRMYVHMLGTLASWSRDAGFKGLVLLFDEVEFVDQLSAAQVHHATEVLQHFAAVTLPPHELGFDPERLYRGGQKVHRDIALRFREDQPLSVIFALTPLDEIRRLVEQFVSGSGHDITLRKLGAEDRPRLVARIATLYDQAHDDFEVDDEVIGRLVSRVEEGVADGNDDPRALVRGTVFILDELRLTSAGG